MDEKKRPLDERFNSAVHGAAEKLDRESEKLIAYINDEVVPAVREHSSRGLRVAAEKLAKFADYMDQQKNASDEKKP